MEKDTDLDHEYINKYKIKLYFKDCDEPDYSFYYYKFNHNCSCSDIEINIKSEDY